MKAAVTQMGTSDSGTANPEHFLSSPTTLSINKVEPPDPGAISSLIQQAKPGLG